MTDKDLKYYLSLPYKVVLYPAAEGGYVVEMPELPGCISQGESKEDALYMIEDAKKVWLETSLDLGKSIPEPVRDTDEFSGKFNVRIPKSLHKALSEKAKAENVSLNQLIIFQLSRGMGHNK